MNFATFFGVMLGDGCLSRSSRGYFVVVTGDINSDLEFFGLLKPAISKIRGKPVKAKKKVGCGSIEYNFSDKRLFDKLKNAGFPVGKKGTALSVPDEFISQMNYITKGYFATDGSLVITNNNGTIYPRIEFSSISRKLLEQVRQYLVSLGIKGSVYTSRRYSNNWNDLYRLQINGRIKLFLFEKKIGFLNPKHKEKFDNYYLIYKGKFTKTI